MREREIKKEQTKSHIHQRFVFIVRLFLDENKDETLMNVQLGLFHLYLSISLEYYFHYPHHIYTQIQFTLSNYIHRLHDESFRLLQQ